MPILLKRVYENVSPHDGFRVLVERLWPRGISKAQARVDLWLKDVAPSTALRQWFNHDPARWSGFKAKYYKELKTKDEMLEEIRQRARSARVTFVYASKEERYNNSVALKEYLEQDEVEAQYRGHS